MVFILVFERHTIVNHVKLMSAIIDAMYSSWRDKLISISSDGENTMIGRTGGVVKLLKDQCTNPILRIWCVPHQLDLIVKKTTRFVDNGGFRKVAHLFSVNLRAQVNLITELGLKCPKDTTRWVASSKMLQWKLKHRRSVAVCFNMYKINNLTSSSGCVVDYCCSIIACLLFHKRYPGHNTSAKLGHLTTAPGGRQLDLWPLHQFRHPRIVADNLMVGVDLATIVSTDDWWLEKVLVVLHIQNQ